MGGFLFYATPKGSKGAASTTTPPTCGGLQFYKVKIMAEKKTKDEFIKQAKEVHGDKYDYSKVIYLTARTKVVIICKSCNIEFEQTPQHHLEGHNCMRCAIKNKKPYKRINIPPYIMTTRRLKVLEYARYVKDKLGKNKRRMTTTEFVKRASHVHSNKYDYSLSKYTLAKSKVIIICPKHGEFSQSAHTHLIGHGCPKCNFSNGEREVAKVLELLNIKYETQKEFPDCIDKAPLRFDFYFSYNNKRFLIEYQGVHHTKPIKHFEQNGKVKLSWYKKHDAIKKLFASKNGFIFIEIPYTEKDIASFIKKKIV